MQVLRASAAVVIPVALVELLLVINTRPLPYSDVRDGREIVAFVPDKTSKGSFTAAFGVFFFGGGKNSLKTEPEIYANRDLNSPIA